MTNKIHSRMERRRASSFRNLSLFLSLLLSPPFLPLGYGGCRLEEGRKKKTKIRLLLQYAPPRALASTVRLRESRRKVSFSLASLSLSRPISKENKEEEERKSAFSRGRGEKAARGGGRNSHSRQAGIKLDNLPIKQQNKLALLPR